MGQIKIKKVDTLKETVNESFGLFGQNQIILNERNLEGDYAELTRYLARTNRVGRGEEIEVGLSQLWNSFDDPRLSEDGQRAAMQVWHDLKSLRMLVDNAGVYVQGAHGDNQTSQWHHHGKDIERTVLCKYSGEPTHIANNKDVTSFGNINDDFGFLVTCEVKDDAVPLQFPNGDLFALKGDKGFFGKPSVHRKPPSDSEPSLIMIAEPDL